MPVPMDIPWNKNIVYNAMRSLLAELDQRNTLGEHVAKNPESYFWGFESHGVSTSKDYWEKG